MKMEQTECSEKLAFKLQTPVNHPEESIQHSEHGESLKSRMYIVHTQLVHGNNGMPLAESWPYSM
jgi:hypothetical protein